MKEYKIAIVFDLFWINANPFVKIISILSSRMFDYAHRMSQSSTFSKAKLRIKESYSLNGKKWTWGLHSLTQRILVLH